jgi:hypothetical protein
LFSPIIYGYLLLTVHKEENGKNYFTNKLTQSVQNAAGAKLRANQWR